MTKPEGSLPPPPLAYDIHQAAKALSVSETAINGLINSGQLPVIWLGRSKRIPIKALEDLVDRLMSDVRRPAEHSSKEARGLQHARAALTEALQKIDRVLQSPTP